MPSEGEAALRTGGLGRRVAAGASILVLGNLGIRILGIVSISLLGRMLGPTDFGIIAIATIVTGISDAVMSRQFELGLIRHRDPGPKHFDTAFTLAFLWGLGSAAVIFALSGPVAAALDEPALAPALQWLCLGPLLDGLRSPRFVEYERDLSMAPEILMSLGAKVLQIAVSLALALVLGDWRAMVGGVLAFSLVRLLLSHHMKPWRPRFSLLHARELLGFGGWIGGTGLLGLVMQKTDIGLIGARLGTGTAGLYNMGAEITLMLTQYLAGPVARAIYPGLAGLAQEPERLKRAYYRAQATLMGALLPLGLGAALMAPELVRILLGPGWDAAAQVIRILAPVSALSLLTFNIQSLLMVQGDTRSMFLRNLVVAGVQAVAIAGGLWAFGLVGATGGRALALCLHLWLSLRIAARLTGDSPFATLGAIHRSLGAGAVMSAGLLLGAPSAEALAAETAASILAETGIRVLAGAGLYGGTHLLLWVIEGRPPGFESLVLGLAARVLRRNRAAAR